jgi:lipoprotein-releasing system permease protein
MPLELDVALAYLRSRPSRLVSAVSLLSIGGIALGVAALVVAMGLLSGYRAEIRDKLLGANAEIVVYPLAPAEGREVEELRGRLSAVPGVAATAAVVYQAGLAASERSPDGVDVVLKGIDPQAEARVSPQFETYLPGAAAALTPVPGQPPSVALGEELARRLDVRPGGTITISVADASGGEPRFVPRTGRFRVARTFRTNFAEYDSEWIYVDRETLRALSRTPGAANVVEVKLVRTSDREAVLREIGQAAGKNFSVADTLSMNSGLFAALRVQQITLFLVIGLIVGVSTFNVVATIVMTVQEKKRDVGILSSLGAAPGFFTRVFLWFGGILGSVGILAGVAFGSLVCWAVTAFRLLSFPPEIAQIYFVSYIPFRVRLEDLFRIVACSGLVILIFSWLSARRAARIEIAEALRYE